MYFITFNVSTYYIKNINISNISVYCHLFYKKQKEDFGREAHSMSNVKVLD
jgi:hypothetical protein